MKCSRIFLNRLHDLPRTVDTVVVIDVLRSFTSAAVALARGAAAIYPVESISAAMTLSQLLDGAVSVGAVAGGDPAPGFDFGNSPSRLLNAHLENRPVVMSTAAGVRGLQRYSGARRLYAGSLVCARATANAIAERGANHVCFVITGDWVDRDGDEDIACADYLEALLLNDRPAPEAYALRVRESDFGRRFQSGEWPNLPLADLDLAADVDRFDFAMPVRREGGLLVIR